jgi:hypothetical protein
MNKSKKNATSSSSSSSSSNSNSSSGSTSSSSSLNNSVQLLDEGSGSDRLQPVNSNSQESKVDLFKKKFQIIRFIIISGLKIIGGCPTDLSCHDIYVDIFLP